MKILYAFLSVFPFSAPSAHAAVESIELIDLLQGARCEALSEVDSLSVWTEGGVGPAGRNRGVILAFTEGDGGWDASEHGKGLVAWTEKELPNCVPEPMKGVWTETEA